jgi:hypothetical protein
MDEIIFFNAVYIKLKTFFCMGWLVGLFILEVRAKMIVGMCVKNTSYLSDFNKIWNGWAIY